MKGSALQNMHFSKLCLLSCEEIDHLERMVRGPKDVNAESQMLEEKG